MRADKSRSKSLQREQAAIAGEKELKLNSLHGFADDIGQRRLRLGELRSERDRRQRQEAGLKDLKEGLSKLRGELKVRPLQTSLQSLTLDRISTNPFKRPKHPGENRRTLSIGIVRNCKTPRTTLPFRLDCIDLA